MLFLRFTISERTPIIPYKYAAEMICDKLAAGIIYEGKRWTKESELAYWEENTNPLQGSPILQHNLKTTHL